ncbi:MAG: RagB/SusD family nutrient uptake outer membrane protein [Prevotellaceae bacterium]|jgi:hypothetical protein|nr:RagB/SusD family nutrient uptake outer membrane protein [Prevotellaceae bacterium]
MKIKLYIFLIAALITGSFMSCADYLESDQFFKDRLTEEKVFANRKYSEEWLAHTFSDLNDECADVASKGHTRHCFADDMYFGDRDGTYDPIYNSTQINYNMFHTGEYSENDFQATWEKCYRGIRNASTFILNIHNNKEMTPEEIADRRGQARFVRAYYYWLLLRKYGPIPLLPDEGIDYTKSYDEIAIPRSTYEECAEFISNEFVLAAEELPAQLRDQQNIARPTRGSALAARAKVLLYAASPLANGNTDDYAQELKDDQGRLLLSTDYKEEKWAKAAAAAKDVMELGMYQLYVAPFRNAGSNNILYPFDPYPETIVPPYDGDFSDQDWPNGWKNIDPFESYRSVFNGTLTASENPELIFTRGENHGGEDVRMMVIHQLPSSVTGWNTHGMTQKQVDAYYMNNGTDCPGKDMEIRRGDGSARLIGYTTQADIEAGRYRPLAADVSLQYADREPRFYASVSFNGSVWYLDNETYENNKRKQIWYYRGNGNGYINTMFWLRTGIGVKKFVHPKDTHEGNNDSKVVYKIEPAIRYADILLIYAEALNELTQSYNIPSWDGAKTYTVSRNIDEMKKGIHPVRIRAGVPDYTQDVYNSRDEFRKKLKRERQIELMGEGQRYYDLRRWKDAPVEEALPIYGCNTLMTDTQKDMFHTPVVAWALQSSFSRKMWFWPIRHSELKRNKRLTQNPGWTYND